SAGQAVLPERVPPRRLFSVLSRLPSTGGIGFRAAGECQVSGRRHRSLEHDSDTGERGVSGQIPIEAAGQARPRGAISQGRMRRREFFLSAIGGPAFAARAVAASGKMLLDTDRFRHYVEQFNGDDKEDVAGLIHNAEAWDWMKGNIPFFECP